MSELPPSLLRIAMLSVHSSPLGRLGSRDTGGMSVYVRSLALELGRKGHHVDIFTRCVDGSVVELEETVGPEVRLIHLRTGGNGYDRPSELYPQLPAFFDALDRYRVRNGLQYDVIHSHYWLSGRVGEWASARWRAPHTIMFHTLGAAKNRALPCEQEPSLRVETETELARHCDSIIAATRREGEDLEQFCDADPSRIRVIPCGVNLDLFKPLDRSRSRRNLGFDLDDAIVLFVGRFSPVKGLERFVEAIAHLQDTPRLRAVVVGGESSKAPDRNSLQNQIANLSIGERINFRGQVPHHRLPEYYCSADVLVLPSHYESFGLVALEALACGTPVVATSVGAADQIILDGKTGYVVGDGSPLSLAEPIRRILEKSTSQPMETERIRKSVEAFSWSAAASAMEDEYSRLTRNDHLPSPRPGGPPGNSVHEALAESPAHDT